MIHSHPRFHKKPISLCIALTLFTGSAAFAGPKYGPNALPLSANTNRAYFQKSEAPDFWALIPYYSGQPTPRACSAANLTLIVNSARMRKGIGSDDKLFSIAEFVNKYTDPNYEKTVMTTGVFDRSNVTNQNVARVLREALTKLKLDTPKTEVKVYEVDAKNPEVSKKKFLEMLRENEKSADDFIFFSFIQGRLTGDPEGGSHVATVAAYDEKKGLVLILDPDREWYEPYWSPAVDLFEAIRDPKSDGIHPGWIHVRIR